MLSACFQTERTVSIKAPSVEAFIDLRFANKRGFREPRGRKAQRDT